MLRQSGNALFLILIAVALFGALSFAVTSMGRSGATDVTREQSVITASSMLQYGAAAAQATQRLMMINGCTAEQISLENPELAHPDPWGGTGNANAPSDGRCHLFDSRGGGMAYRRNPTSLDDSVVSKYQRLTGRLAVIGVGEDGHADLSLMTVLVMNDQTRALCEAYNAGLGLPTTLQTDGINTNDMSVFRGTYTDPGTDAGGHPRRVGDSATDLIGEYAGCFQSNGWGNYYFFYYVMAAR